jgi:hypothetical protein
MIGKFAAVPGFSAVPRLILLTMLMGAVSLHAQQTPGQTPSAPPSQPQSAQPQDTPQAPDAPAQDPQAQTPQAQPAPSTPQSSSTQEATPEESAHTRASKAAFYKKWSFNVGGGASLTNGNTANFVRGGGGIGAVGAARNYSKYFGLRLDFQFDNLPLRSSALQAAQASGATDHVYSLLLGPIINVPVGKNWGGYIVGGLGYLHRSGKLDSSSAIPGSACNSFFLWWGHCFNGSLPINGNFLHSSVNQFGDDFGGGITRKVRPNIDFYAEFRYIHGSHTGVTTDLRPITIGLRW